MKEKLMITIENALKTHGFKYIKSKQHFIRKYKSTHQMIHLNFGLNVINPSLNVKFINSKKETSSGIRPDNIYGIMLSQILNKKCVYLLDDVKTHKELISDLLTDGIPFLEKISNIN